ncbi:hypothetical protein TNIN_187561 [Trichonephila inaurata madagascariensis]|uniref:Uncharacterized protein n=1 Tax=Trichonephila inaurata madagascariensis TaxID=2747483 RepID=A0A8X6XG85_9ARAC|nr:hypothetical protein TNIN_187561 [Trichonephila inaurata madagascariensis]
MGKCLQHTHICSKFTDKQRKLDILVLPVSTLCISSVLLHDFFRRFVISNFKSTLLYLSFVNNKRQIVSEIMMAMKQIR